MHGGVSRARVLRARGVPPSLLVVNEGVDGHEGVVSRVHPDDLLALLALLAADALHPLRRHRHPVGTVGRLAKKDDEHGPTAASVMVDDAIGWRDTRVPETLTVPIVELIVLQLRLRERTDPRGAHGESFLTANAAELVLDLGLSRDEARLARLLCHDKGTHTNTHTHTHTHTHTTNTVSGCERPGCQGALSQGEENPAQRSVANSTHVRRSSARCRGTGAAARRH